MNANMLVTLQRLCETDFATYGQLLDAELQLLAVTLEPPWKDNQHNLSCIPPGMYEARRYQSPKRGYAVYKLDAVPGRDAIEIHIGNLPKDTDGCILVGTHFGKFASGEGVIESGVAFRHFMATMPETFTLTVLAPPALVTDTAVPPSQSSLVPPSLNAK